MVRLTVAAQARSPPAKDPRCELAWVSVVRQNQTYQSITCQDNPSEPSPLGRNSRYPPFGARLGCSTGTSRVPNRPGIYRAFAGVWSNFPTPRGLWAVFSLCLLPLCPSLSLFLSPAGCLPPHWALQGPGPPLLRGLLIGSDCGKVSLGFRSWEPHGGTSVPRKLYALCPRTGPGAPSAGRTGGLC